MGLNKQAYWLLFVVLYYTRRKNNKEKCVSVNTVISFDTWGQASPHGTVCLCQGKARAHESVLIQSMWGIQIIMLQFLPFGSLHLTVEWKTHVQSHNMWKMIINGTDNGSFTYHKSMVKAKRRCCRNGFLFLKDCQSLRQIKHFQYLSALKSSVTKYLDRIL